MNRIFVSKNFEKNSTRVDCLKLVAEVILPLISPPIDVVWLKVETKRPYWILLLCTILRVLSLIHHTHYSDVISSFGQLFTYSLASALVCHLLKMSRPSILEVVERGLAIE